MHIILQWKQHVYKMLLLGYFFDRHLVALLSLSHWLSSTDVPEGSSETKQIHARLLLLDFKM